MKQEDLGLLQRHNYRESLGIFRRGPEILNAALAGVSAASRSVPAPGKWTIRQIALHLFDAEIVAGMRPLMATFDQDLWANHLGYNDCDALDSAAKFRILRADISAILDSAGQIRPAREAWNKC
jgi:hypothetical protein